MAEACSILIVLIETHPRLWQVLSEQNPSGTSELPPATFLRQVLAYLNACLLVDERLELAVLAVEPANSQLIYTTQLLQTSGARLPRPREPLAEGLHGSLTTLLQAATNAGRQAPPALAGALCRALCLINAMRSAGDKPIASEPEQLTSARILCLTASADEPSQYMALMNSIFAAQHLNVMVDACVVGEADSPFLQQAADMTKGAYLRPGCSPALLQYLLTAFTGSAKTRSLLHAPRLHGVDFCASCFCHKKAIDLGFVCSVCLSIFCSEVQECTTCGTGFHK